MKILRDARFLYEIRIKNMESVGILGLELLVEDKTEEKFMNTNLDAFQQNTLIIIFRVNSPRIVVHHARPAKS